MPHSTLPRHATIDDHQVDVASLETIALGQLTARQPDEIARLLNASQMPGFFYLDLRDESGKEILASLPDLYAVAEKFFHERIEEEKMGDKTAGQNTGWVQTTTSSSAPLIIHQWSTNAENRSPSDIKPREKGINFEIARDKMIGGGLVLPKPLENHSSLLERFSSLCHTANQTMLSCLSDALELHDASRFENSHRDDRPSATALNLIYAPMKRHRPSIADTTHTDSGTLTLLFCDQWGIMVEHPETKAWAFVEPRPGCALINVGDFLQALSGNKLHSCRHCITQPVDGFQARYYIVSFLRPDDSL